MVPEDQWKSTANPVTAADFCCHLPHYNSQGPCASVPSVQAQPQADPWFPSPGQTFYRLFPFGILALQDCRNRDAVRDSANQESFSWFRDEDSRLYSIHPGITAILAEAIEYETEICIVCCCF